MNRESGYVQYRFQIKLLTIAAVKESTLARTAGTSKTDCQEIKSAKIDDKTDAADHEETKKTGSFLLVGNNHDFNFN